MVNVAWNMSHMKKKNIGNPQMRCVSTSSILRFCLRLSVLGNLHVSFNAPSINPYFASVMTVSDRSLYSFSIKTMAFSAAALIASYWSNCLSHSSVALSVSNNFTAMKREDNFTRILGFFHISACMSLIAFSITLP